MSATASLVALVVGMGFSELVGSLALSTQAILTDALIFLVHGGLIVASGGFGLILLYTRQLGRWWVLLPALGLLTVPQLPSMLLWVVLSPFPGDPVDPEPKHRNRTLPNCPRVGGRWSARFGKLF